MELCKLILRSVKIQNGDISKKRPRKFGLTGTKDDGSIGNAALETK
jgi:hypothetical protein